jgi:undecaprenyl-diphosphatase
VNLGTVLQIGYPPVSSCRTLLQLPKGVAKRVLVAIVAIAALVLAFALLAREVAEGQTRALDERILLLFRTPTDHSVPIGPLWLKEAMRDVTALGSTSVLAIVVAAVVGYLLISGLRHAAAMVLGSVAIGVAVSNSLKWGFARPRPEFIPKDVMVYTASFPSGHTTLSAVVYLTLGALLCRTQASVAVKTYILSVAAFLTAIVGASRVYLGVHWPTDVIAGWLIGGAWALVCASVMTWLQRRGQVEPEQPAGPRGA